jgi:putative peptidoglycan lipid II flippase
MRLTIILGIFAIVNILLSFLYVWYIITTLGASAVTDAFFAAIVIPQLVLAVVSDSLTHVLVPLLANRKGAGFFREAWSFFQGVGLLFGGAAIILSVSASIWVPWIFPGFDKAGVLLTTSLLRIQLIGMVFSALTAVLWSAYHAQQRFIWCELSPILALFGGFAFLLWGLPRFGITAAAWAMVLKLALQSLLLIPVLGPYHIPAWKSKEVKEAWRRIHPLLLGTTYYKTDQLVDRFLLSMAPVGSITLLHLAAQIYSAGNTILNRAIGAPMVPMLAQKAQTREWPAFIRIFKKRLILILWITGLTLLAILLFGKPVLSLVFAWRRFTASEVSLLWLILIGFAGVWIGGALGQVLAPSFYAKGNTTTPTKIGIFGFSLGLLFKFSGFYLWGVVGVAIGTSLYYLLNSGLLYLFLNKEMHAEEGIKANVEGATSA